MTTSCGRVVLVIATLVATATPARADDEVTVRFDGKPITAAKPGKGVDRFQLGDAIHVRVYVTDGKSIKSHQNDPGSPLKFGLVYPGLFDDNDVKDYYQLQLDDAALSRSYADVTLLADGAPPKQKILSQTDKEVALSVRFVENLVHACGKEGAKETKLAFSLGSWGQSEFTVVCSADGAKKAQALARGAEVGLLEKVRMAKPGMKNRSLEKQALAAARKQPDRTGIGGNTKVLKLVITSDEWSIEENGAGRPINRSIWVDIAYRADDPNVCNLETVHIQQDYKGGKPKGAFYVPGTNLETKKILCKHAK